MKNRIINFLIHALALILMIAMMLAFAVGISIAYEDECIADQEYSVEHECVKFMSYLEEDEFGEQYINKIYHYSDGNIVEEHDYLRVEF